MAAADDVLGEQLAYYRASALEMDEGIRRVCETDDTPYAREFRTGLAEGVAWLQDGVRQRDALEVAAGTGVYTEHLAPVAKQLVALDASPESLKLCREHVGTGRTSVVYDCADVFDWTPPRQFESVVFAFWLSHVPLDRFRDFWNIVASALVAEGEVRFVDAPAGPDGQPITHSQGAPDIVVADRPDAGYSIRRVEDGRQFRIVRILWTPAALTTELTALGWNAEFDTTARWLLGRAWRP